MVLLVRARRLAGHRDPRPGGFSGQYSWRGRHIAGDGMLAVACVLCGILALGVILETSAISFHSQVAWKTIQAALLLPIATEQRQAQARIRDQHEAHADVRESILNLKADSLHGCRNESRAHITITDDGHGFDTSRLEGGDGNHFGLIFMRERMQQIGGSMAIDSKQGGGTVLRLDVPTRDHGRETGEGSSG